MKTTKPYQYTSSEAKESDDAFNKQLKKQNYKEIAKEWNKKLAEEGMPEEPLVHNTRTIAWENQDKIRDFFLKLDTYLTNTQGIKLKYRRILELWSEGKASITDIANEVELTERQVFKVIKKYKALILSLPE